MVWLAGWSKKIKLTIDYTKIYEDLVDFPVMIKLTNNHADIFTTIGNSYSKILLLDSIKNDILYTEIIYWNSSEQKAVLWVKLPTIPTNSDVFIYLFYDVTQSNTKYIGTTGSLAAMQVWTNNYAAVYHMGQTINTPFTVRTISASEYSGTSSTGTIASASVSASSQNCTGLTKATGALSIWMKVNNPDYIDLWSGVGSQLEVSSSSNVDTNEWYFNFSRDSETTQYFLKNISTTYKKFIFPFSEFTTAGGELDVTNIYRIRWYVQAATETVLTIYWKNAEIVYYPGGILDSVGHSHGKPMGNMSSSNLVEGLNSKATLLDGVNNYINCGFSEKFSIISNLTLEALVKQTTVPLSSDEGIISKFKLNYGQFSLLSKMNTGVPIMRISPSGANIQDVAGTTNITTLNDFVYLTGTYKPGIAQEIFVNGIKENSYTTSIPTTLVNNDVAETVIGSYWDNTGTRLFNGIIDEIFISSTTRSDNWIKTFNDNLRNNLISDYSLETLTSGTLNYNNRIKLTIPYDYIDSTLYNFPVLINISNQGGFNKVDLTNIFDELESSYNYKKLVITDYTGQGRCFCEIESWSQSEKKAYLWVNVPTVNSTTDTILYLYYDKYGEDNNFIGGQNSYIGNKVWNSNHFAVYHLSTNPKPYIYDSTENKTNLLPHTDLTENFIENAEVSKSIYFNGYTIARPTKVYTNYPTNNFAFECVCKVNVTHEVDSESNNSTGGTSGQNYIFRHSTWYNNTVSMSAVGLSVGTNGISVYEHCSGYMPPIAVYNGTVGTGYNHICVVYNNRTPIIYLNGTKVRTGLTSSKSTIYAEMQLGDVTYGGKGNIHKVRIYNSIVSDAWIRASYYNSFDKLVTYTLEEETTGWLKTYENGTLSPWAKRIPIEIDYTKIDSNLSNFPLLINISETSGISNKDISSFFNSFSYTNEEVSTFGINSIDTKLWTFGNNSQYITYISNVNNGIWSLTHMNACSGGSIIYIKTKYTVLNFDVSIKVIDFTDADGLHGVQLHAGESGDPWYAYIGVKFSAGAKIWTITKDIIGSNVEYIDSSIIPTDQCYFRITRNNAICNLYYKHNEEDAWILQKTINTNTRKIPIFIRSYKESYTEPAFTSSVSNYTITNSTLFWSTDNQDKKYKIAITTEDGVTQCPVEIEDWNVAEKSLELWTKLPIVRTDANTKLYLYYDTTKTDNTAYVGLIGSSIGTTVWPSDYEAVYHLSQVPTSTVLDSTSKGRNFVTRPNLTVDNIVTGPTGKATTFNGSNQEMDTSTLQNLSSLQTGYTLEVIGAFNAMEAWGKLLTIATGSPAAGSPNVARYNNTNYLSNAVWGDAVQSSFAISQNTFAHYGSIFKNGATCAIGNGVIDSISNTVTMANLSSVYIFAAYGPTTYTNSTIKTIRISNIAKTAAWIKASYHSDFDTLLYFNDEESYIEPTTQVYKYEGYIKEKNQPIMRTVALYERSSGELKDITTSNSSGFYSLETINNTEHFVVVLDNIANYKYNALIKDRLLPNN